MTSYCPFSGLEVKQKPEWKNIRLSERYQISLSHIGEKIMYNRAKGFVDLDAVEKAMAWSERAADDLGDGEHPYVMIEDLTDLVGSTAEARRSYVEATNKNHRRTYVIFCNVSTPVTVAIQIGKRFIKNTTSVQVVKNYQEAIELAISVLGILRPDLDPLYERILNGSRFFSNALKPVTLTSESRWQIRNTGYANRADMIDHSVLHSSSAGFLKSSDIPSIERLREQIVSDLPDGCTLDYIIVDLETFKAGSRTARFKYMQSLKSWHSRHPFRMYIAYNANLFMRTALKLAKPLMPFKVHTADDLDHALSIVHQDRYGLKSALNKQPVSSYADITQPDIDALLGVIGNLNWEVEGVPEGAAVSQDHPFFYIYEALKLIKEELDSLFVQRRSLENQLHQSQKMESVGRLAGGIAHDFNNILQMIMGNTELSMVGISQGSELERNLQEIKMASMNGAGIVKQLLNFSRKTDPKILPVEAIQVIDEAVDFLRSTIPSNIQIKIDHDLENLMILADPVQMNQVLMNICINASQEMELSGGEIRITTGKERVEADSGQYFSGLVAGDYLKMEIEDTGPGIDPKIIDHIFDPYFTTKAVGKGSGMGLSVVHGIVKNHGGLVTVKSHPGRGAVFTIFIPMEDTIPVIEHDVVDIGRIPGRESVLFVDDEKTINHLTQKGLENMGYTVQACSDPETALGVFRSDPHEFDIVVSDMVMPQMTGALFFDRLKSIRPDIPVVACTGYSSLIDEETAMDMGFSAFIMKPFFMEDLSKVIREVMDEKGPQVL